MSNGVMVEINIIKMKFPDRKTLDVILIGINSLPE